MAKEEVEARQLRDSKRGSKQQKEEPKIRKTKEEEHRVMILDVKDVEWANATLAPMGLSKDHQPVVRAPASLAGPILSALRNVDAIPHFRETLKTSTLGRTVNAFRSHQNPEISKLAKELVSSWKKVLQRGPSLETRQIRKDNKRRERDEARAEEEEAAKRARGDQPEIKSCTCVWSPSGDRLKGLAQARDPGRGRLGKHLPLVGALARGGSGRWGQMVNDNGEKSTLAERLKDKGLSFDAPTGGPVSLGDIPSGQGHAALAAGGTLGFKENRKTPGLGPRSAGDLGSRVSTALHATRVARQEGARKGTCQESGVREGPSGEHSKDTPSMGPGVPRQG